MNPVAFEIFGISIRWYGIMIAIGVVIALSICRINFKKKGLDFEKMMDMFMWAFPIGIIGARLYYVAFQFSDYKDNLIQIFNIRAGGLAIHGGLIFGIGTAYIYSRIKKIDFIQYADAVAPSILVAQAIGRWGNFFNQEAHGGEVSKEFISHFPKFIQNGMYIDGAYYQPTFLYESIWDISMAVIVMIVFYKLSSKYKGVTLCSYVVLYSLGRFFIEGLRTDSLLLMNIRVAQLVSAIGVIVGIILIIIIIMRTNKNNKQ